MTAPGERLGGYLLVERLGQRGNADLWLGRQTSGDQVILDTVPIKAGEGAARQIIESRLPIARSLSHQNVLPLLDGGIDSGQRYWVWPYLEGLFLDRVLEAARGKGMWPPPGVSARIGRSIGAALDYIHHLPQPLLARELSPANVLITREGRVLVTELGTAGSKQNVIETAGKAQSGSIAYMSPELAANEEIDPRSDLFALGAVLWEMLAARPLFQRATDLETLEAVREAQVPALPAGCPASLVEITMRLLARVPEHRFKDAGAAVFAFDHALKELPDAGVDALIDTLEGISSRPKKGRTFALSEASGGEQPVHQTMKSDPGKAKRAASEASGDGSEGFARAGPEAGALKTGDEFFDAIRDGDGAEHKRFQILGRLGSGGMGEVYRVRDRELEEVVALKIIPKGGSLELSSIERLRREVRLARRIASDHVCRIYDIVDLGDGTRGLMMELIEGTTLSEMMKAGIAVDYPKFARWAEQLCDGLAAAHGLSIIHRDLKPENVMIRADGSAVILDFGIARSETPEKSEKLTQAGIIMGTPLYMSPEQLSNRPLDGRSDLYALGLILAELITGRVPRGGANYAEILDARVVKNSAYSIKSEEPKIPDAFAAIIDSLIKAAASERPATASKVRDQLRTFLGMGDAGESEVVGLESAPETKKREITVPLYLPPQPNRTAWWAAIALLCLVLGTLLYFLAAKKNGETIAPIPDAQVIEVVPDAGEVEVIPPPPPPPDPPPPRKGPPDPEPM